MTTVVSIDSEVTGDATPSSAPFTISAQSSKDTVTVKFTPTVQQPGGPIRQLNVLAWAIREGGVGRTTGRYMAGLGAVCGLAVCGRDMPVKMTNATQITAAITYAKANDGAGDGTRTMNVYVWDNQNGTN